MAPWGWTFRCWSLQCQLHTFWSSWSFRSFHLSPSGGLARSLWHEKAIVVTAIHLSCWWLPQLPNETCSAHSPMGCASFFLCRFLDQRVLCSGIFQEALNFFLVQSKSQFHIFFKLGAFSVPVLQFCTCSRPLDSWTVKALALLLRIPRSIPSNVTGSYYYSIYLPVVKGFFERSYIVVCFHWFVFVLFRPAGLESLILRCFFMSLTFWGSV